MNISDRFNDFKFHKQVSRAINIITNQNYYSNITNTSNNKIPFDNLFSRVKLNCTCYTNSGITPIIKEYLEIAKENGYKKFEAICIEKVRELTIIYNACEKANVNININKETDEENLTFLRSLKNKSLKDVSQDELNYYNNIISDINNHNYEKCLNKLESAYHNYYTQYKAIKDAFCSLDKEFFTKETDEEKLDVIKLAEKDNRLEVFKYNPILSKTEYKGGKQ